MSALGKAISHESARGHVTGEALYTDDLVARQHAPLHAWPVQVQHAHARVKRLNAAPALDEPGVLTVLTQADVTGNGNTGPARQDEPLFPDVVEYYGQPLAWVLAESEEAARRGAARVTVEVEPLPATLEIDEGIAAQSFLSDAFYIRRGDSAAAMVAAPKRLAGEFHIGGQEHFYLETQAALAYRDESGEVFVQSSTQHPTETQAIVARVLGVQKHAVTVQCVRMGGGFGGKETQANTWAAVAALGAVKTGRPVRVRLNRTQDMTFTGKRHPFLVRYQVGFDERGKLLALDIELYSDGGYSLDLSEPVLYRAMFHCDNCYLIPALTVMGRVVKTHKCSNTAFRGFGGPQGMVAIEEIVDHVARSVGRPAHEVRAENFYSEGDETHYGQPVKDAGRIARIWESLREKSAFEARRAEVEAFNRAHVEKKRGLAITPVKFGISFTTAFFNQAGALVLIYQDGSVQVNHGGTEMGQGLYTKMLQVAAHALGVPIESVRMMPTRTDKVPNTSATAASSGSDLNGAAVKAACESLKERLAGVAAQHFGSDPADIIFDDGQVYPMGKRGDALAFGEITRRAYLERIPLFSTGYYRTPDIHFSKEEGRGKPFHYFAYGAAVSEVEVDGFTGQFKFLRVDILHDVGNSLSPLVDRGQIEGGFAQGLGWLTQEELKWDASGQLATRGASTYKLPTLGECPEVFNVSLLEKAEEPGVVYGSKAVGEPPLMLAISAREALRDAVAAFGRGGCVELGCPATPEAVFFAIEALRASRAGSATRAAE